MEKKLQIGAYSLSHTDIVRFWVIACLTLSCIFITWLSLARHIETIYAQLFYFPLLYATYFYPRKGLYLAGACAVIYEILAYFAMYPDIAGLLYTTGQAILFVCVAAVVSYFTEKVNTSEAKYRGIFESSLLGIALFDKNTFAIRLANTRFLEMLGYTSGDTGTMAFSQLFGSKEEQRLFFEKLGSSEDIANFETRLLTRDGRTIWVTMSWSRISESMMSCSVIDISQRKAAEQAAADNYTQYKQVTENAPTGIVIVKGNRIVYSNPAFCGFSGYAMEDLMGKELTDLIHGGDRELLPDLDGDNRRALPREELRFMTKDGETRLGALFFTRITRAGEPAVLINIIDVTEYELLKARIRKETSRRQGFISTLADDLRAPILPALEHLSLVTKNPEIYGIKGEAIGLLDRCARGIDRELHLINQMLERSALEMNSLSLAWTEFLLSDLILEVIDTGGYTGKANIPVNVPEGIAIMADRGKMGIVIDSLIANAISHSRAPRRIRIAYSASGDGLYHQLAIQDNGIGFTESQLDEIFEPRKSPDAENADPGPGKTGVPLSMVKRIVQLHGGFISVDSIAGLGSTFTVNLPVKGRE
jgi:PAS domain S-box-containing protein